MTDVFCTRVCRCYLLVCLIFVSVDVSQRVLFPTNKVVQSLDSENLQGEKRRIFFMLPTSEFSNSVNTRNAAKAPRSFETDPGRLKIRLKEYRRSPRHRGPFPGILERHRHLQLSKKLRTPENEAPRPLIQVLDTLYFLDEQRCEVNAQVCNESRIH